MLAPCPVPFCRIRRASFLELQRAREREAEANQRDSENSHPQRHTSGTATSSSSMSLLEVAQQAAATQMAEEGLENFALSRELLHNQHDTTHRTEAEMDALLNDRVDAYVHDFSISLWVSVWVRRWVWVFE